MSATPSETETSLCPQAFQYPQGLSVECSVRPTDTAPATTSGQVHGGFAQLAPLLLSRAADDERTYGLRRPTHLVVKWKLFPGARKVRQAQVAWPAPALGGTGTGGRGVETGNAFAARLAKLAAQTFDEAVAAKPFRVSRVVLALTYARAADDDETGTAAAINCSSRAPKRGVKRQRPPDPKQRRISHMFQCSKPDS